MSIPVSASTPSRILLSGASGVIGSALEPALQDAGWHVSKLVRAATTDSNTIFWDPEREQLDPSELDGYQAVIHLGGISLARQRWSSSFKTALRFSRIKSTALLSERLAATHSPPKTLLCASAVGYYGNRGDERLNEDSQPGSGFLADLCQEWEAAADTARGAGIRVVHLRLGVVLTPRGGMLAKLVPIFKCGLGAVLGDGRQFLSWISLHDLIRAMLYILETPNLSGPVNVVASQPVTNTEFTRILAAVLHRPAWLKTPAFVIKLLLGELGREMLLTGQRAYPDRLLHAGFQFECPDLAGALRRELY